MKTINLGASNLKVPVIATGCMRLTRYRDDSKGAEKFIRRSIELGANFFEHADIYGGGRCEEIFAKAIDTPTLRDKIILQSKCGIISGKCYNFSYDHIVKSVDGSLRRLNTEYLDVLVLHRPDALVEPEEVARAFDQLQKSGKVRNFGVSNHKAAQIKLLKKSVKQPLVANQLQFGIAHTGLIDSGMCVNMKVDGCLDRDGDTLDYCRLEDITIQAWSPFLYGFFEGVVIGSEKYPELNKKLDEIAAKYNVTPTTVATAWILRHPAKMQVVCGTMTPDRLTEICAASDITLTHAEWYELYLAAGNMLP